MKLLEREVVGVGVHRSGWPRVVEALRKAASGNGVLLDDFVESSFVYGGAERPHGESWVGVFHHPVRIASPLARDEKYRLRGIGDHPHWPASRERLAGAVALCEEVAVELREWLHAPVLVVPHPTETDVRRWNADRALERRRLLQVGVFLRNTRAIFQVAPVGWRRTQLAGHLRWHRLRGKALKRCSGRPDVDPRKVEVVTRVDDEGYDELLATSVVLTELYGAAANNVVVECLARGTPLLVNRLPAVEEYLGREYPLFYGDLSEVESLLEPRRLEEAHQHLSGRAAILPSFDAFAERVRAFVDDGRIV